MRIRTITIAVITLILGTSWLSLVQPPPGAMSPYLNGQFPSATPGFSGSWKLVDFELGQNIPSPLKVYDMPNSDDLIVLSKNGTVWRLSEHSETLEQILDVRDRTFRLTDAGALSIAFHPDFDAADPNATNSLFLFYRNTPNPTEWHESGYNRLVKYTWDQESQSFPNETEEILIQQFDRFPWHDGGGLFFDSDGYLHLGFGDEGQDHMQVASTQRLDGGFFNGSIRIDIDNDPARSHPIRRQPLPLGGLPQGWTGGTYSQGYSIPNDNPWVDEGGGALEEFYTIGLRSPYSMTYDRDKEMILQADVGSNVQEEINIIEKGDNLQWPYMEGVVTSQVREKPANLIGSEKVPYYTYDRSFGSCIVGGGVYRHDRFSQLNDHYLFGDFTQNKLAAIPIDPTADDVEPKLLLTDVMSQQVYLPFEPKMTGVSLTDDGRVFVTIMGEDSESPGTILELQQSTFVADPAEKLSDLQVFADMTTLAVVPGILPYTVNSPLWSDGAEKKRWIALPNDGTHDSPSEQIVFSAEEDWKFPEGTVFIKHFELPTDLNDETKTVRLETRFFVLGGDNVAYGLTYRWNEEGTEAYLLPAGESRLVDIMDGDTYSHTQQWDFPSRDQCMSCHNSNAKFVLGVKTHQLNGEVYYPHLGAEMNQLDFMDQAGMFTSGLQSQSRYLKSYGIGSEEGSLDQQVRSYLDANCASCHREGGLPTVFFDLRYTSILDAKQYDGLPNNSHASTEGGKIIVKGDHQASELWIRDASTDENKMPPIGRSLVDEVYVDSLAAWIDKLPDTGAFDHEVIAYPNPTQGWLAVRVKEEWQPPFKLTVSTISGHKVYEANTDNLFTYIDLSDFISGTYIITVASEQRRKSVKVVRL